MDEMEIQALLSKLAGHEERLWLKSRWLALQGEGAMVRGISCAVNNRHDTQRENQMNSQMNSIDSSISTLPHTHLSTLSSSVSAVAGGKKKGSFCRISSCANAPTYICSASNVFQQNPDTINSQTAFTDRNPVLSLSSSLPLTRTSRHKSPQDEHLLLVTRAERPPTNTKKSFNSHQTHAIQNDTQAMNRSNVRISDYDQSVSMAGVNPIRFDETGEVQQSHNDSLWSSVPIALTNRANSIGVTAGIPVSTSLAGSTHHQSLSSLLDLQPQQLQKPVLRKRQPTENSTVLRTHNPMAAAMHDAFDHADKDFASSKNRRLSITPPCRFISDYNAVVSPREVST